jgi:hypothetical protein
MVVWFVIISHINGIISYRTPQDYLHATEGFLMQKELENNLLIGLRFKAERAYFGARV